MIMPELSKHANDEWWDTWMVAYGSFAHAEYDNEADARRELDRVNREFPEANAYIVYTENAGYGAMRYKMFGVVGFKPLGEYHTYP